MVYNMTYYMQRYFLQLVLSQWIRANTSHMACMDAQRGGDQNPYETPRQISMVTGFFGGIEISTMRSLHDVLHATVFQIIDMATQLQGNHI